MSASYTYIVHSTFPSLHHLSLSSDVDGAVEGLSLRAQARALDLGAAAAASAASAAACGGERQSVGEDLAEGLPEFRVEDGVDDGVEGRVGISQPRQDLGRHDHMNEGMG